MGIRPGSQQRMLAADLALHPCAWVRPAHPLGLWLCVHGCDSGSGGCRNAAEVSIHGPLCTVGQTIRGQEFWSMGSVGHSAREWEVGLLSCSGRLLVEGLDLARP